METNCLPSKMTRGINAKFVNGLVFKPQSLSQGICLDHKTVHHQFVRHLLTK